MPAGRIPVPPVLLVESDFFLSGEIRALLEETGLEVRLAGSAREALPWAGVQALSLAVIDAKAPGEAEVRLAEALRESNPKIPLVLLFSPEALEKGARSRPLAGTIHVPKPFRMHSLHGILLEAMGLTQSDQPGTTIRGE